MARDLKSRVKALEHARVDDSKVGGVITLLRGETVEQGLVRAAKEGRTGSFLVVPPTLALDEWAEAVSDLKRFQRELRQKHATAEEGPRAAAIPDRRDPQGYE